MNTLGSGLFGLVFVLVGAGILLYVRRVAARARQSRSWPSVEGVVERSAVVQRTRTTADADDSDVYTADVAYRYRVQGRDYSATRITMMDYSSSAARHAQDIVAQYPAGAPVRVYHHPADPSDAVLEPGGTRGIPILGLIGWAFALAGLLFLYASLTGRFHAGH